LCPHSEGKYFTGTGEEVSDERRAERDRRGRAISSEALVPVLEGATMEKEEVIKRVWSLLRKEEKRGG
jgi:hypothetical protein